MLYRPLFWTAFWCEDWLAAARYRGATRVLVSSASAKTAFTLAYCMSKRAAAAVVGAPDDALAGLKVVGLTSSRNLAFTRGLGLYDEVVTYDDVESTSALRASDEEKWIYADVASSSALNARIFARLGTALVGGITLGMSTVGPADAASSGAVQSGTNTALATSAALSTPVGPAASAPGPAPSGGAVKMESFFMVEWLAIRRREWSTNRIVEMQATAWRDLMRDCPAWVRIERVYGGEAVRAAYEEVVSGKVGPERGFVWSMWNGEESGKIVARL